VIWSRIRAVRRRTSSPRTVVLTVREARTQLTCPWPGGSDELSAQAGQSANRLAVAQRRAAAPSQTQAARQANARADVERGTRATVAHGDRDRERLPTGAEPAGTDTAMLTLVSPSAVWKTQRAPASIAGAAQVRRLVGDSCMCRDDFHRAQERFQDVCASKRPPTTHCCFCSMRQRGYAVIDSSPRCSHSSEGAARHRMPVRRRDFSFRQRVTSRSVV
jgi:hypothetical protein